MHTEPGPAAARPATARPAIARPALIRAITTRTLVSSLGALLLLAPAAQAHGGKGRMQLLGTTRSGARVQYRVGVTFVGDGDGANDATVTATVRDAQRRAVGAPVKGVKVRDGVYTVTVTPPSTGRWSVKVASLRPPAVLTIAGG